MTSLESTFPISTLPTIPDDLDMLDSRKALPYFMALMKNTFIRAFNNVFETAPQLGANSPCLPAFFRYVSSLCTLLTTNLEGDAFFFSSSIEGDKVLRDFLKPECNPDFAFVYTALSQLQSNIVTWSEDLPSYSPLSLRKCLSFAPLMVAKIRIQLDILYTNPLATIVSNQDLRHMIYENMEWLASHSDITFLVPFVISHHDFGTSPHWPTITEQGAAALPSLMEQHAGCWRFAPIDPLTKQANPLVF